MPRDTPVATADAFGMAAVDTAAAFGTDDAFGVAGGAARMLYHGAVLVGKAELEALVQDVEQQDPFHTAAAKIGRNAVARHLGPWAGRLADAVLLPVTGALQEGLWE